MPRGSHESRVLDTVSTIDTIRYSAALLFVVAVPASVLHWLLVHPFTRFWRRLGVPTTLALLLVLVAAFGYGMFLIREPLLSVDFGFRWPLAVLGNFDEKFLDIPTLKLKK